MDGIEGVAFSNMRCLAQGKASITSIGFSVPVMPLRLWRSYRTWDYKPDPTPVGIWCQCFRSKTACSSSLHSSLLRLLPSRFFLLSNSVTGKTREKRRSLDYLVSSVPLCQWHFSCFSLLCLTSSFVLISNSVIRLGKRDFFLVTLFVSESIDRHLFYLYSCVLFFPSFLLQPEKDDLSYPSSILLCQRWEYGSSSLRLLLSC